jgi:PDZ domain
MEMPMNKIALTALALCMMDGAATAQIPQTYRSPNGTVTMPGAATQTRNGDCTTTTDAHGNTVTQCGSGNRATTGAGRDSADPNSTLMEDLDSIINDNDNSGGAPRMPTADARRAMLGLQIGDVRPDSGIQGAVILQALPNGPAQRSGLQAYDVVVAIDGHPIQRSGDVPAYIAQKRPNDRIRVDFLHYTGDTDQPLDPSRFVPRRVVVTLGALDSQPQSGSAMPMPAPSTFPNPQRGSATPMAQSVHWRQFVDPRERAFSIDVPAGWQVEGGTVRYSPIAYNFVMELASPDGAQQIRVSDPDILPFTIPSQFTPPEGSRQNVGQGLVMIVARYHSGEQFATMWGQRSLRSLCGNPSKVSSGRDNLPSRVQNSALETNDSGHAIFVCGDKIAYVFSTTTLKRGPFASWQARDFVIGLAPVSQIRETVSMIYHMVDSSVLQPQWFMSQLERDGKARGQAQQQVNALMQQQRQHERDFSWSTQATNSTQQEVDQVVRGVTTRGGKEVDVQGKGEYFWECNDGAQGTRTRNTQSYMSPGANCRALGQ